MGLVESIIISSGITSHTHTPYTYAYLHRYVIVGKYKICFPIAFSNSLSVIYS